MSAETDWEDAQAEDLAIECAMEDARDPYRGEEPPEEDPDFMEAVRRLDFIDHDGSVLFWLECEHADEYEVHAPDSPYVPTLRRVFAESPWPSGTVWEIGIEGSEEDWSRGDNPFELAARWVVEMAAHERRHLDLAAEENRRADLAGPVFDTESPF